MGVGWGADGFDHVAAGDRVAAIVGDVEATTVRVAAGVLTTDVGLRVGAVGVDAAVRVDAGVVDIVGWDVHVLVGAEGAVGAVVVGAVGVGVSGGAGAVGKTAGSWSPGGSNTGCSTVLRFDQ